jgi:hypothetical protein
MVLRDGQRTDQHHNNQNKTLPYGQPGAPDTNSHAGTLPTDLNQLNRFSTTSATLVTRRQSTTCSGTSSDLPSAGLIGTTQGRSECGDRRMAACRQRIDGAPTTRHP